MLWEGGFEPANLTVKSRVLYLLSYFHGPSGDVCLVLGRA